MRTCLIILCNTYRHFVWIYLRDVIVNIFLFGVSEVVSPEEDSTVFTGPRNML